MDQKTRLRKEICVSQGYWNCPAENRGLLDVAVENYHDFFELFGNWFDGRKARSGLFPLTIELRWDDKKGIALGVIDHRHESEAIKTKWHWFRGDNQRVGVAWTLTNLMQSVKNYNDQYRAMPRLNTSWVREATPIGEFGTWRYTVSPCLFKIANTSGTEYFSLLRCYDKKWKKGDDAMMVELVFDEKDGPVNIPKTASSVLNAIRFTSHPDDAAWVMATWLAKQKKIIKRAQKKPINTTGLGEFETLRISGFYRPKALVHGKQPFNRHGVVKTEKDKTWSYVDTATVSNPNGDIGILFACGNNLFLFVEQDQTYVLSRTASDAGYKAGEHKDYSAWRKIDPEDGWAEVRIAKAINVFFESKAK